MMPSLARRGLIAALLTTATLAGCKCGSKTNTAGCQSDQECIDQNHSDRWFCDKHPDPAVCTEAARECDTASDCCPAQICNLQGHFCADKFTPCTGAGSCTTAGQVCKTSGVRPTGLGCTFDKCTAGGVCGDGTVCFNGFCVGEPPCGGGCTDQNGQHRVCVTATNLCSPSPADASCQRSCATGQELVLHDPDNIFDTCDLKANTCECVALPPLVMRDVSRYSSLALSGANLYVSAYDGEHGDLVVHTFDKNNLTKPSRTDWVDGVPATGKIGGDPNGPRHGIIDAGPNVGQYTSIAAAANGDLYVSYYDVDNGDLKFASRYGGPSATWNTPITLDGTSAGANPLPTGDVGLYSAIALTSANFPAIAYFRRGSYDSVPRTETGRSTGLIYAIANKAQPLTRADWTIVADVDAVDRPAPACGGACSTAQLCVADAAGTNGERCATPAPATRPCAPACSGQNACVVGLDLQQTSVCAASRAADSLAELPAGVGLMPALAFLNDKAVIAYHDSINHTLKAVMAAAAGAAPAFGAPVIIDGLDATGPKRDTGRFPSIGIGPSGAPGGQIAIAFEDLSSQQLLLYTSNTLTAHAAHDGASAGLIHVVDNGLPNLQANETWHAQSFPGAQSSVAFTPSGKIAVAYQDAMAVDLVFSVWDPGTAKVASKSTLRATGAAGFYPRMVIDAGTAYVSSATIKAASASLPGNTLGLDAKPAP